MILNDNCGRTITNQPLVLWRAGRGKNSMTRKLLCLGTLAACGAVSLEAQTSTPSVVSQTEPLVVQGGVPLRLILTDKLRFKLNQPVHARIVEPVYAFDREVLPSGTEVLGRITGFQDASRWIRIAALLGGNFTPLREPQLTFDTLMLNDHKSISIRTSVSVGSDVQLPPSKWYT